MSHGSSTKGCGRREFVKGVAGTAAATLGLGACGGDGGDPATTPTTTPDTVRGPRARRPNPFVNGSGDPILVSVEGRDFDAMLEAGLRRLGGLQRLVSGGEAVLINPNCNMAESYPGISRASSVASLVRQTRAVTSGTVTVADEGFDATPQVYTRMNLFDTVEAAGGVVEYFTDTHTVRRPQWGTEIPDFRVYRLAYDAPVIISICNVKRHYLANFSCALKNNVGIVAGSGASVTRGYLHGAGDLPLTVAEIAGVVNPELFVVDAAKVLTRSGPSVSQGDPVVANRLILCGDMVATDAYCARLLADHDPYWRPSLMDRVLERAAQLGCGQPDLGRVEIREISV